MGRGGRETHSVSGGVDKDTALQGLLASWIVCVRALNDGTTRIVKIGRIERIANIVVLAIRGEMGHARPVGTVGGLDVTVEGLEGVVEGKLVVFVERLVEVVEKLLEIAGLERVVEGVAERFVGRVVERSEEVVVVDERSLV